MIFGSYTTIGKPQGSNTISDLPVAKKSLGQHWLKDQAALQDICQSGEVASEDTVLEIGPGTGTLTQFLVRQANQVVAVEFDSQLAADLPNRVKSDNLKVVQQDILSFDLTKLPPDYKVVANIPYYLTSNLIRTLSESSNRASLVVILVQKEVAQRVAANPGQMSLLSVSAQYYWHVSLGAVMPAKLFTPAPKVDSQILILKRRSEPLFSDIDSRHFFAIVKAGFSARRKTLHNSLSAGLRIDKQQVHKILEQANISPAQRAQTLSLDDWYRLSRLFTIPKI